VEEEKSTSRRGKRAWGEERRPPHEQGCCSAHPGPPLTSPQPPLDSQSLSPEPHNIGLGSPLSQGGWGKDLTTVWGQRAVRPAAGGG
jgi:hypothetical protein